MKLADRLRADHEVLEIEGRRVFSYSTTYFETPDLRCFTDHVEGRVPRFKARTRLYEESGDCVFEVKLKRSDDEADKRQIDVDYAVQLAAPSGDIAAMDDDLVLVETKSEAGKSPADRELARMEFSPVSLSKYRVGMSIVGGADSFGSQPGSELFHP